MKTENQSPEYLKHSHAIMISAGLLFALLGTYNARFNNASYLSIGFIFVGGLIIGIAIAHIKAINREIRSSKKQV